MIEGRFDSYRTGGPPGFRFTAAQRAEQNVASDSGDPDVQRADWEGMASSFPREAEEDKELTSQMEEERYNASTPG